MKSIKRLLAALVLSVGVFTLVPAFTVGAVNPIGDACESGSESTICDNQDENVGDVVNIVINTLLFVVGVISVVMIIVGGLRYATSGGDSGAITSAKNTILYAVIGLVVSLIAFAVVNWVLQLF